MPSQKKTTAVTTAAAVPVEKKARRSKDTGTLAGPQALNQAVWAICDVLRRAAVGSALRYVPELTWILFLRVLDEQEALEREEAEALGLSYAPSLGMPWRWQDWSAPSSDKADAPLTSEGLPLGWKRRELFDGPRGAFFAFVNNQLLPYLRNLRDLRGATPKQKFISEIVSSVERVRVDTEANFADVLDKVHALKLAGTDTQHQFMLSQVYEGLLLKMGEKNSDGGQFYTPRELIRAMVRAVDPRIGDTVCDPCCGTGRSGRGASDFALAPRQKATNPPRRVPEKSESGCCRSGPAHPAAESQSGQRQPDQCQRSGFGDLACRLDIENVEGPGIGAVVAGAVTGDVAELPTRAAIGRRGQNRA